MNETVPDNYRLWEQHDAVQEQWRDSRPVCSYCGEHIQDDGAAQIRGEYYCRQCLDDSWVYFEE